MFGFVLIMALGIVISGLVMGITPFVIRKNIHFGVSLPDCANELEETKNWKRLFFVWSVVLTAVCAFSFVAGYLIFEFDENIITLLGTFLIFAVIFVQIFMYFIFHGKAKKFKNSSYSNHEIRKDARIMVEPDFRNDKVIIPNFIFILVGFLIILATVAAPVIMWDQIPDYVPTHFNSQNVATTYSAKSWSVFALMPITQAVILAIFVGANFTFKITKQNIRANNAKVSIAQNRAFRYALSKYLLFMGCATLLLMTFIQFMFIFPSWASHIMWITIFYMVLILVWIFVIVFKYGQGGERFKPTNLADETTNFQQVDDDEFWKWGVIYYNPNDSALFVEKRFGIGMTLNFAKWPAWVAIGLILLVTLVASVLPFVL